MKATKDFAACFDVDKKNPNVHRPLTINAGDEAAMKATDLNDISAGKVKVDMNPAEEKMPDDAIPASDNKSLRKNLESIASGDISVDMSK